MTLAAREALKAADVVIGYQTYIDQVRPLLSPQQEIIARPMQSELERARQALDSAAAGRRVALISSGDIGMYAMAGPVFELLHQRSEPAPEVRVLPGVSAFQAAAARMGAAINHDLCTISLSDLLTPWELIERRLWAAAEGDFVLAMYNPRSKGRDWQLARACDILRTQRPPGTPVVLARNVTRPDEQLTRTTLGDLDPAQADMLTVVLIGNSQSYWSGEKLVTPRGYKRGEEAGTRGGEEARARGGEETRARGGEDAGAREGEDASGHQDIASSHQHPTYPINLSRMHEAPVIVVGGGLVGERKVRGLLAVGAQVTLLSPDATPHLRAWAADGRIVWAQRPYQPGDLAARPLLVFAATSERAVNAQVAQEAAALGLLCNVADAPHEGAFHLPAVHREDGLVMAISTEGASPGRARRLRERLSELLQQEESHDEG
jgi:cobalt-precorrin 5A hydrolase/precorrin-3B C17-methyltransferase